jgi:hypothetical protein
MMSILIGCSKPCEPQIKFIHTPKTKFYIPHIDVTEIKRFEPKDIKAKDGVVTTSIKTFKDISNQNKRLWVQKEMFELGFKSLKEQIERYSKEENRTK